MEPFLIGVVACVISFGAGLFLGDKYQWIQVGLSKAKAYMSKDD